LLRAVNEEDLLLITNHGWVSRGRKLSAEEKAEIKAQANDFADSLLWEYISKELEYAAFVRGRKAMTDRDNDASHFMFYNLDLIQQFLKRCQNL
jgi:hypothetical protein